MYLPQGAIDRTKCLVLSRNTRISTSGHPKTVAYHRHTGSLHITSPTGWEHPAALSLTGPPITPFALGPGVRARFNGVNTWIYQIDRWRIDTHGFCVHILRKCLIDNSRCRRSSAAIQWTTKRSIWFDGVTNKRCTRHRAGHGLSERSFFLFFFKKKKLSSPTSTVPIRETRVIRHLRPSCSPSSLRVTYVRAHFIDGQKSESFARAFRLRRRTRANPSESPRVCRAAVRCSADDAPAKNALRTVRAISRGGRHDPPLIFPTTRIARADVAAMFPRARAPVYDALAQHPNCRQLLSVERAHDCLPPPTHPPARPTTAVQGCAVEHRRPGCTTDVRRKREWWGGEAKMCFGGKIDRER